MPHTLDAHNTHTDPTMAYPLKRQKLSCYFRSNFIKTLSQLDETRSEMKKKKQNTSRLIQIGRGENEERKKRGDKGERTKEDMNTDRERARKKSERSN